MFNNRLYPPEEKLEYCVHPNCKDKPEYYYSHGVGYCEQHALDSQEFDKCEQCGAVVRSNDTYMVNGEILCIACYYDHKDRDDSISEADIKGDYMYHVGKDRE